MSAMRVGAVDSQDAQPQPGAIVRLDVYVIELPANTVADNDQFWKRVDEQAVGSATAERLNRNGIRCGTVPKTEGGFFSRFFDKQPGKSRHSTVTSTKSESIEVELDKHIPAEDLFVIGTDDQLRARSYTDSANLLAVGFGPTPRAPGSVRLSVCPVVRSDRKHLAFTQMNQAVSETKRDVDRVYEIGLTADVPEDCFFLVAPGTEAKRPGNVGERFLIKHDTAELLERVIVVVPTFLRLDGRPTTVNQLTVK